MSNPEDKRDSFQEYLRARESLICEDRKLRVDHARASSYSDLELKADRVFRSIRATEASTLWAEDYGDIPHPYPGMEFLNGKRVIKQSQLFKLLVKMPKGALLHAHLDATVDISWVLTQAEQYPAIHVRAPQRITEDSIKTTEPRFLALPPEQLNASGSLCDETYERDQWISFRVARESFAQSLGGPEGFDRWVTSALTLNPTDAYKTHNTATKIWTKFQSTFNVSEGIIRFSPLWSEYIKQSFLAAIEDGISYVEHRVTFFAKHMYGPGGKLDVTHRDWVIIYSNAVNAVKEVMQSQGRRDEFIGGRIIYNTLRIVSCEELEWYLEDCIVLKQEFPDIMAGFDLVGEENSLKPLIYYAEPLLRFRRKCDSLGLDIPFIFHAGETFGDGTRADDNLYDAIMLGTKRIGHGFALAKHPHLMELCREKDILVESCPISNEILRLTSSMPMHPLPVMMNHGIPVALSSDDPAIFGNMGSSFDFYQVAAASEVTGLLTLGELARDSIKYSTLDEERKSKALSCWEKHWVAFLEEVASIICDSTA